MGNRAGCPICDVYSSDQWSHLYIDGADDCRYCGTPLRVMKIIENAQEVLYDGYGEGVELEDSPIIKLAIEMVKKNNQLEKENAALKSALSGINASINLAKVYLKEADQPT